ncbi:recombinase family protein [Bacillus thuringiensis]
MERNVNRLWVEPAEWTVSQLCTVLSVNFGVRLYDNIIAFSEWMYLFYEEKISGTTMARSQLQALLDKLQKGDTVIVHEISRLLKFKKLHMYRLTYSPVLLIFPSVYVYPKIFQIIL